MRKKLFGTLLTISMSRDLYDTVKNLSEAYELSMGEVARRAIEYSTNRSGDWMVSRQNISAGKK